jgi:hypothetical protein
MAIWSDRARIGSDSSGRIRRPADHHSFDECRTCRSGYDRDAVRVPHHCRAYQTWAAALAANPACLQDAGLGPSGPSKLFPVPPTVNAGPAQSVPITHARRPTPRLFRQHIQGCPGPVGTRPRQAPIEPSPVVRTHGNNRGPNAPLGPNRCTNRPHDPKVAVQIPPRYQIEATVTLAPSMAAVSRVCPGVPASASTKPSPRPCAWITQAVT